MKRLLISFFIATGAWGAFAAAEPARPHVILISKSASGNSLAGKLEEHAQVSG